MEKRKWIRMDPRDNVAILLRDAAAGEALGEGIVAACDIPQAHKAALKPIPAGGAVIRYGVTLGYALRDIAPGEWVNEHSLRLPDSPPLDSMPWGMAEPRSLPPLPRRTFLGYDGPDMFAGTRNLLAIHTTVQCVTGVLNVAVRRIREELLPRYPHVDGVVPINHAYGCGVAIDAPEARVPIRMLRNLVRHPNFGGEVMCVSLGCEKLRPDMLLDEEYLNPDCLITLQDCQGFGAMVEAIMAMADRKLKRLNERRRVELPLSRLLIGMQCGGSDAFSGVTANPAAGFAADMLVAGGATVLFSEVTEVRDGVHWIARRCVDKPACDRLAQEMRWYDGYLAQGGVDRSANTTPGNKAGGLSNIVEKSMGSIAKSGTSPVVEVLSPGERPTQRGLIYAATPASDIVCGPCQLASGIGLQVFMTGRGTPYGLAAVPVIKVCSRSDLKRRWPDLIDVNAGVIADGDDTIEGVGSTLLHRILACASGEEKPYAEQYGLENDLCLFNPAPIT